MEKFDSAGSFEGSDNEALLRVKVLDSRAIDIPQSLALEMVYEECANHASVRSDTSVDDIDITQPSDNKYATDAFHIFLALTNDLGIDADEVREVLGKDGIDPDSFELHLSIAQERIESKDTKTVLSNNYDVIAGRFRREVREYEKNQKIEADTQLIIAAQAGDEESLAHIFNRNGDIILCDLEKHAHEAPEDIIELSEQAVKKLIETSIPIELATGGLNHAVQKAVRDLLFEKIPVYRESVEREQREEAIASAISRLKVAEYICKLIDFEDLEKQQAEEFVERPALDIDKQQVADVVNAGVKHLKNRALGAINPKIEVVDRITNSVKNLKKRNALTKEFGGVFRQHVLSSARMKQEGIELFDITDIYEHKYHTDAWVRLVNRMINITAEAK